MSSLILQTAARLLQPLLLLYSLFMLLRGHNEPGGGFTGGLIAAAAFALYALAFDVPFARQSLWISPHVWIATGLLLAVGSGVLGMIPLPGPSQPAGLLTGRWYHFDLIWLQVDLGTPLFFDIGVYCVVVGITMMIVLNLASEKTLAES